jgi:hypothetical protein
MTNIAARMGAALFGLWGVLHIAGGAVLLAAQGSERVAMFGTTHPAGALQAPGPIVNAVLGFHAYNLLWLGAASVAIAIFLNWKNSSLGYLMNMIIVGAADLGLIVFLLLPGYMSWRDAAPGPVLWLLAAMFSTLGLLEARGVPSGPAASQQAINATAGSGD